MRHVVVLLCLLATTACEQTGPAASSEPTATVEASAPAASSPAAPPPKPPPKPVRVAFTGDVCMSLKVGINIDKRKQGMAVEGIDAGYPFTHVVDRLKAADVLVGNLECVLSLKGKQDTNHNPFRCTMAAPEVLQAAGFDLVSVANNHAMDFGQIGFRDGLRNLEAAKLPHFGKETFTRKPQAPIIHELRGTKIGMLAYYWPPDLPLVDVKNARPLVDVLFVFMHWGMDDTAQPMELQRRLARDFVDAGVDVVVGTHAHVLQPTDWYKGKFIAYGLGNFVFSGMMHTEAHRIGAMLEVDIAPDHKLTHRMVKMRLEHDGAPRWIDDPATVTAETARPPKNESPKK